MVAVMPTWNSMEKW